MLRNHLRLIGTACVLGTLALVTSCASEPPPAPALKTETQSVTAKVVSVDTKERLLVLQGAGEPVTIEVPAAVHRLEDIKVGDEVAVTYYQGLAAVFASKTHDDEATASKDGVLMQSGTVAMPASAPPGRAVGRSVSARVTIKSVDQDFHTVTFMGPRGLTRTVGVNDPQMQAFVSRLKPGDEVDLTYFEALAAQVIPAH